MKSPIHYGLCNQVVTVYHREGDTVTRVRHGKAFFDMRQVRKVKRQGEQEGTSFLLVIPGDVQTVFVGDKVLLGDGPAVDASQWARWIPPLVPGLAVVSHADVKHWEGKPVHTEAGGTMLRFNNLNQNR